MESSFSNSEERESQQLQERQRQAKEKCLGHFESIKKHLKSLQNLRLTCSGIKVHAIKEIEKGLNESKMQTKEGMVNEGIALDDGLDSEESTYDNTSTKYQDGSSSSGYDADAERAWVDKVVSNVENAAIEPSYDNDTLTEVHHSNNDTFENMFAHGILNHQQPESIPNTYVVTENNSNIISDIPNMDPDRGKEEHDDVNNEQQRALFAFLVNNLRCEVEKCTKVNCEAQQANALLTKELERYKKKEKQFAKETTTDSKFCKKIKLLNEEISNLKS
ncbi:hypothetical protein Tco_0759099 [Tanacetum coccineum]